MAYASDLGQEQKCDMILHVLWDHNSSPMPKTNVD